MTGAPGFTTIAGIRGRRALMESGGRALERPAVSKSSRCIFTVSSNIHSWKKKIFTVAIFTVEQLADWSRPHTGLSAHLLTR